MKADGLYRLRAGDEEKLKNLLSECFVTDPLYCELIPDYNKRKKMLPELIDCELEDLFEYCEIYADSPEVNAVIAISDETNNNVSAFKYYLSDLFYCLKAGAYIVRDDLTLKTLKNFFNGRDFLLDRWTQHIENDKRIHVNYLAVRPSCQGNGHAGGLMRAVLKAADERGLATSLETHNSSNIKLYEHFGFEIFEVLQKKLKLRQYCMVRKAS